MTKPLQSRREPVEDYIESDPEVMGGTPVVKGTRVPVHSILGMIEGGDSIADIRASFPYLSEAAIVAAARYAREHPRPKGAKRFR